MYANRTRIKKDILAEFVLPKKKTSKVIILAGGAPGYPERTELMFWLAKKGYAVFNPRYRGSWESGGSFLKVSPHKDVLDIIDVLQSGFADVVSGAMFAISKPEVYLIGSSFGGPAVLLASLDKRVKKVVALGSVVDWRIESEAEPQELFHTLMTEAFGEGYRFLESDWSKLFNGSFYNPVAYSRRFDPQKICMIHGSHDAVVTLDPVIAFAKEIKCRLHVLKKTGHLSVSDIVDPKISRIVFKFLNS